MLPPPPRSTLFPYTTLFRSQCGDIDFGCRDFQQIGPDGCRRTRSSPRIPSAAIGVRNCTDSIRDCAADRKSTRLNSSHVAISYAVFCLKKKNDTNEPYSLAT